MLSEDPLATERSTPTCVGTIRRAGLIGKTSSVHPHVRGDDASAPGVIRTHDPLLRRYFALSAVLP